MISNWPRSSLISGLKFIFSLDNETAQYFLKRLNDDPFVLVEDSNPSAYVGTGDHKTPTDYYLFAFYFEQQRHKRDPISKNYRVDVEGLWEKLRDEMKTTNSDLNKIKSTLAIALIDNIIARIRSDYGDVQESYVDLKKRFLL